MRCLLLWALELIRESSTDMAKPAGLEDSLDRLVVAVLVHCHRSLGRCFSLLSEIESSSYEKYFESKEQQRKLHRRLLRVALELRDIVHTAFRGRNETLKQALSTVAFESLRDSLEGTTTASLSSKEFLIREFLTSTWVSGYQDVEIRGELSVPEQLSMDTIPLSSDQLPSSAGFSSLQQLAEESSAIVCEFDRAINGCFEDYLETQKQWAETDAVRDLEYDGDSVLKRLSDKYKSDVLDLSKTILIRRHGADNRWKGVRRKAVEPWTNEIYWKVAPYTDRLGRRILLVQNRCFDDHREASYELMLGKEREAADLRRQARLEEDLSEVMRRNAEAFTLNESLDESESKDNEGSDIPSDSESSASVAAAVDTVEDQVNVQDESEYDEWDKIDTEEIKDVDADGDIDGWARAFIWSDSESIVARFESVMIVSLQVFVQGKLLLTTHGLYFHQVGEEISVITKQPTGSTDNALLEKRDRRWRLNRLAEVHGRRFMLRPQALELFFSDSHELFLNFPGGTKERDRFHAKLRNSCKVRTSV
jgi:hypothetical protein